MDPRHKVARVMVDWYFSSIFDTEGTSEYKSVIWVNPETKEEPLRFILVVHPECTLTQEIEVFGYDPTEEVPFSVETMELSELTLSLVSNQVLSLPEGWVISDIMKIFHHP